MDRLSHLNPAQRDAVETLSGPLLVLAGAGTGKTRVITYRMVELMRSGVPGDRILSVTFTNKAAREMQERTSALLGKRAKKRPHVSTFHSLCVRVLRQEIEVLGYPKRFTIYDRGDQESAARTALRDVRLDEQTLKPADLLNRVSRWKTAGVGPAEAVEYTDNDLDFLAATAYRRYQRALRASGAVDFDDLLLLTNRLFAEHPDALERQQSRFDHVQIDEYQDTNAAQFELAESLVAPHKNLCVVGDDDQSIYGWRGAEVEHILNFAAHFPGAKTVRLEDNYRCTDRILDLANRLVRHNRGRHDKTLVAHKPAESDVAIREFADEQHEAESVVREIRYLIEAQNVRPGDVAILFRTNEQPRIFETELRRAQIRYLLVGGQSFFDRREIRDLLAYLKAIASPRDDASLLRIINTPARGIGTATVEKINARAIRERTGFWDAVAPTAAAGEITPRSVDALTAFRQLLEGFRVRFEDSPRRMDEHLEALIEAIDYHGEIDRQYKEPQMRAARRNMLDQMTSALREYRDRGKSPTLTGFLDDTALMGRDEEFNKDDRLSENAVKLMTLHSSKGLEFPRVYLVGLEEGILPHRRSVETGEESAIAEERRLTYVGVTRAMDHLTITRSGSRTKWGRRRKTIPSRFLREMVGEERWRELGPQP